MPGALIGRLACYSLLREALAGSLRRAQELRSFGPIFASLIAVRGLAKPQLFTAFPSILGPVTSVAQRESCIACQHVSPDRACSPKRRIGSAK